jgi:transcriptional regulator with XRE-family HTH domain
MVDFGIRLKGLRNEKKLSQLQLSERLGITKSMVSAYETSMRYPSFDVLIKISKIFRVSTDFLLGIEASRKVDISDLSETETELIIRLIDEFRKLHFR